MEKSTSLTKLTSRLLALTAVQPGVKRDPQLVLLLKSHEKGLGISMLSGRGLSRDLEFGLGLGLGFSRDFDISL